MNMYQKHTVISLPFWQISFYDWFAEMTPDDVKKLEFLIGNPLGSDKISTTSTLQFEQGGVVIEIGPR